MMAPEGRAGPYFGCGAYENFPPDLVDDVIEMPETREPFVWCLARAGAVVPYESTFLRTL
jgi:hypothetical protein